jgi:hypothetical protein
VDDHRYGPVDDNRIRAKDTKMQINDTDMTLDDAADTLRFCPVFDDDVPFDPDATSIYDLTAAPSPRRRRQIRDTHENVLRLREALANGWDIGPELAYEEQRLAALEAA